MIVDKYVRRLEIPVTYFGELHIIEGLKQLKDQYFSDDRVKGSFEFSLLLDHEVETGRDKLHDDAEVAFLIQKQTTSRTILRKYYFSPMMLVWLMRAIIPSSLFLYRLSCSTSFSAHICPSCLFLAWISR